MMPRFIAIPVGMGDAFYLETCDGSVLVDGGRSAKRFPYLFHKTTGKDKVDIVIATHNDADHANGILGFLQAGDCCSEVWLPGRWAQVLPQVLRPWEEIVHVLVDQVFERFEGHEGRFEPSDSLLEQYVQSFSMEEGDKFDYYEDQEIPLEGWSSELISLLEKASSLEETYVEEIGVHTYVIIQRDNHHFVFLPLLYRISGRFICRYRDSLCRLLFEALDAAHRIRQIAIAAYHHGIPVRWFMWDPKNPSGGNHWLRPLNSKEILKVVPIKEKYLLQFLALTASNRESLVFWASLEEDGHGVLFTADSDLKHVRLPSLHGAIVTAPHHGSRANKNVYQMIQNHVIWVRSDGRFRSRPCQEYIQAPGVKYCTLCRGQKSGVKQKVELLFQNGQWQATQNTRKCSCV